MVRKLQILNIYIGMRERREWQREEEGDRERGKEGEKGEQE